MIYFRITIVLSSYVIFNFCISMIAVADKRVNKNKLFIPFAL